VVEENGHQCKLEGRMEKVEGSLSCYMREGIELRTEFKSLKDIVSDIRDSMKWISRTIIGSVIVALVTVAFTLIKSM
jgi:hypothetical protein